MKKAAVCSMIFVIFSSLPGFFPAMLFGQYPDPETIPAYRRAAIGLKPRGTIDFSHPDDLAGWTAMRNVRLSAGDRTLRIEATGDDPYFRSPDLRTIPAFGPEPLREIVFLKLRMKNDNGVVQVFWTDCDHPDFSEARSVKIETDCDGAWHDYSVRLEPASGLVHLRIDPGVSAGSAEIDSIALTSATLSSMEIKTYRVHGERVDLELSNHAEENRVWEIRWGESPESTKTFPISAGQTKPLSLFFPGEKRFESLWLHLSDPEHGETLTRRFDAFFPDAPTVPDSVVTLSNDRLAVDFSRDGSGALIRLDGAAVGLIAPLASPELRDGFLTAAPCDLTSDAVEPPLFVTAALKEQSLDALRFDLAAPDGAHLGTLRFSLADGELRFELDAESPLHGPIFRPLGTMRQALLCGNEYLEEGEHSSSSADFETSDRLRFAPRPLSITIPLMAILTRRASFALLYDDPMNQAVFAVPDFLDGLTDSHRMNLFGAAQAGTVRIAPPELLEEGILWGVKKFGLPEPPKRPRSQAEQDALTLAGFTDSELKDPQGAGWRHAILPGDNKGLFAAQFGSDFLSTIWELTGELPEVPKWESGGGHIRNWSSLLVSGEGELAIQTLEQMASVRRNQLPDGSFRYHGKYLKGHWDETSSGHCGNALFLLTEHWRLTGDDESLAAALRGLAYVNRLKTPRGAQVWELSLHTPDIMAASRCSMANITAFEATGEHSYLDAARRWAIDGLPFVYLWEQKSLAGSAEPIMKYATIAVFGATNFAAPNWIGLPVQWCGLDYCHALIRLAEHDATLDWRCVAEGILVSAECQQYPDGPSVGLLPDSFAPAQQQRNPFNINPSALHLLRRLFDGRPTSVFVAAADTQGNYRIASPYPVVVDGDRATVTAPKGAWYQVLVNGRRLKTVPCSTGADMIQLP